MLLEVLATRCLLAPTRFWAINKLSVWFFMDLRGSLGSPLGLWTSTGGHGRFLFWWSRPGDTKGQSNWVVKKCQFFGQEASTDGRSFSRNTPTYTKEPG